MMNHYTDKETVSRRTVLKTLGLTTAAAASLGFPAILKAADTVTIGAPLAMTGETAVIGPLMKNALEMAVAEINALGGGQRAQARVYHWRYAGDDQRHHR
jgi:ABC-type branched-subunit amino acid transport system substrate-binding protein